ncbi:uncharacterized protein LODBEIA_P34800 [Lodderomyces beijingensis]|uniref:Histone-lysine N-methyltransferase, H3 lysine-79 specific n=1 Tax=Lodderomyces beijingensis TaxID=1775926 RepID=A0ABP0ZQQ6_9ASCO
MTPQDNARLCNLIISPSAFTEICEQFPHIPPAELSTFLINKYKREGGAEADTDKSTSLILRRKLYSHQKLYGHENVPLETGLHEESKLATDKLIDQLQRLRWRARDLESFIAAMHHDLTKSGLARLFPRMPVDKLISDVVGLKKCCDFGLSARELELLETRNGDLVEEELFLRSLPTLHKQGFGVGTHRDLDSSRNRNGKEKEKEKDVFETEIEIETPSDSKSAANEMSSGGSKKKPAMASSQKRKRSAFEEFMQDKKQLRNLKLCISVDLTRETLSEYFPDFEIEEVCQYISTHAAFDKGKLTRNEKESITKYIKDGMAVEDIYDQFPLREQELIDSEYNRLKYVSSRRRHFKNTEEKLIYEAGMAIESKSSTSTSTTTNTFTTTGTTTGLSTGATTGTPARHGKHDITFASLQEMEQMVSKVSRPHKVLTQEEKAEQAQRQREREVLKQKLKAEQAEKRRLNRERALLDGSYAKKRSLAPINQGLIMELVAAQKHFESVTGDRQSLEEGAKRKTIPVKKFSPEDHVSKKTWSRQAKKIAIRQKLEKERLAKEEQSKQKINKKKKNRANNKRRKVLSPSLDEEELSWTTTTTTTPEYDETQPPTPVTESEVEEYHISPYDPPDINSDTLFDIENRRFFIDEIYQATPQLPELKFRTRNLEVGESAKDAMTNDDESILYDDELGAHVIGSHERCYKDYPISFPQYLVPGTRQLNHLNSVKVRFLLYPEHCESYVLAAPKDNELDPVHEIIKLFMLHYALYFSHSDVIKKVINEFSGTLEQAVEENDFAEFIYVIDKWNKLMLYLSPNTKSVEKIIREDKVDINEGAKMCLNHAEIRVPKLEDLDLETFYSEICYESTSPFFHMVKVESTPSSDGDGDDGDDDGKDVVVVDENADISICNVEPPTNVEDRPTHIRPENYVCDFYRRLKSKSSLSRYTIQQLLLRVYARIVSTDSRKLRSYKAFTAEVYGELLPSFTSEVLEKVQLRPGQKFYDLGSGVGNTTFQAALEFGAVAGGCELMQHASMLTSLQENLIRRHLACFGIKPLELKFALGQSFVNNEKVKSDCLDCDVLIINNYLFDGELNDAVGKLLVGLKTGTKVISLRNFISPRYRATFDTVFDYFSVSKHEMSDYMSVSWTANKVPYYISIVEDTIRPEYLGREYHESSSNTTTTTTTTISYHSDRSKSASPPYGLRDELSGPGSGSASHDDVSTPPTEHNSEPETEKNE